MEGEDLERQSIFGLCVVKRFFSSTLHDMVHAKQSLEQVTSVQAVDKQKHLREKKQKLRESFIEAYPDLVLTPEKWNWHHIIALSPDQPSFRHAIHQGIHFESDLYHKFPFEYLIRSLTLSKEGKESLQYIFDQVIEGEAIIHQLQSNARSMTDTLLYHYHHSLTPTMFVKFISLLEINASELYDEELTNMGSLKGVRDKTFKAVQNHKEAIVCEQRSLTKQDTTEPQVPLQTTISGLSLTYHLADDETITLLRLFQKMASPDLFEQRIVQDVIDYFWYRSKPAHFIFLALFSCYAILFSFYSAVRGNSITREQELIILIIAVVISALFILVEIVQCIDNFSEYISEPYNWIDTFATLLPFAACLLILFQVQDNFPEHTIDIQLSWCLLAIYLKWISYLRLIDETRKLHY